MFFRTAQHADSQITGGPDATREHPALFLILAADVGPAHGSDPIAAFENLHLANPAAALPATNWNSAFKTHLRAAQNRLVIRTRKYVG
jgi:hypothetical protein